jgi:class 3 adenylate cyclase
MKRVSIGLALVAVVAGGVVVISALLAQKTTPEATTAKAAAERLAIRASGHQPGRMRVMRLTRVAPSVWIADIVDATRTSAPLVDESCARIDLRHFEIRSRSDIRGVTYIDALREPNRYCPGKNRG